MSTRMSFFGDLNCSNVNSNVVWMKFSTELMNFSFYLFHAPAKFPIPMFCITAFNLRTFGKRMKIHLLCYNFFPLWLGGWQRYVCFYLAASNALSLALGFSYFTYNVDSIPSLPCHSLDQPFTFSSFSLPFTVLTFCLQSQRKIGSAL